MDLAARRIQHAFINLKRQKLVIKQYKGYNKNYRGDLKVFEFDEFYDDRAKSSVSHENKIVQLLHSMMKEGNLTWTF